MREKDFFILTLLFLLQQTSSALSHDAFCRFQEFRCKGGALCLLSEKLCNGVEDCPDGEDERGNEQWDCSRVTLGTSTECGDQRKYFRCRFGGCIRRSQVCDGVSNCWGGTDEASDLCGRKSVVKEASITTTTERLTVVTTRPFSTTQKIKVISTLGERSTRRTKTTTEVLREVSATTRRSTTFHPTTEKVEPSTSPPPPLLNPSPTPNSCPPLQVQDGENLNCVHTDIPQVIDCRKKPSPEGTRAQINCAKYWSPPPTGSRSRERICSGGVWKGGSRSFRCELDCGEGGYQPVALVAGGLTSKKGKWPWHAGIYEADPPGSNSYTNICGATLVSANAVITAGHCVTIPQTNDVKNRRDLLIFLGKFYRSAGRNDEHVQTSKPLKIILHPDYNYANLDSDLAIIFLHKSVKISPFVHPVCLPSEDEELSVGSKGMLAGWGSVGDRVYPEELQEVELPYVSSLTCRRSHSALKALIRQTSFCAGHRNGTSACDGDSGSGLVFSDPDEPSKWLVGGVVSGGVPKGGGRGCDPNHFVAFTNVAKFRRWIDGVLDVGPDE